MKEAEARGILTSGNGVSLGEFVDVLGEGVFQVRCSSCGSTMPRRSTCHRIDSCSGLSRHVYFKCARAGCEGNPYDRTHLEVNQLIEVASIASKTIRNF